MASKNTLSGLLRDTVQTLTPMQTTRFREQLTERLPVLILDCAEQAKKPKAKTHKSNPGKK